jgi:hypothetical protein
MDREQDLATLQRLAGLAEEFHDKRYRDGYVAAHTRSVLARQMRNFRGELTQTEFGAQIGKRQTVISRLESSAYGGWGLRTMLEIARKQNVALFCRFVDLPTFLKYTNDLSDNALRPQPYDEEAINRLVEEAERIARENALKELFSDEPERQWGIGEVGKRLTVPPPPASRSMTVTAKVA